MGAWQAPHAQISHMMCRQSVRVIQKSGMQVDRPCPRPRQSGHAAELGKVARLGVEPLGRLGSHLTECLAYNFL